MGAPRTALWLKNWRKELTDDGTFARQPGALRRPYAIAKGFEPVCTRRAMVRTARLPIAPSPGD